MARCQKRTEKSGEERMTEIAELKKKIKLLLAGLVVFLVIVFVVLLLAVKM